VAKREERATRVSGGAAEMLSSRYACRVFTGMEVTSECGASGIGGTASGGIDINESAEGPVGRACCKAV
jgi:hypothetical protein